MFCVVGLVVISSCEKLDSIIFPWEETKEIVVSDTVFYRVKWVSDGDTFWIDDGSEQGQKIRLLGIDAPESVDYGDKLKQEFGEASHAFSKSLLENQKVRLEFDVRKYDKYGRTLAYVWLEDGRFVNREIVANGFAVTYNDYLNDRYEREFSRAEDSARLNRLGLWED